MPGPGEINGSQSFKLTIENYRTNNVANNGARANAPAALNNAEPAAAPQPAVAQARKRLAPVLHLIYERFKAGGERFDVR